MNDLVIGGQIAHRAGLAKARYGAVDQPGVFRAQGLIAHAQPVHHAGAEVFHQHIGPGHKALQDRLATRVLEVQRQRPLARVLRQE